LDRASNGRRRTNGPSERVVEQTFSCRPRAVDVRSTVADAALCRQIRCGTGFRIRNDSPLRSKNGSEDVLVDARAGALSSSAFSLSGAPATLDVVAMSEGSVDADGIST
jgi:hypothetical protein